MTRSGGVGRPWFFGSTPARGGAGDVACALDAGEALGGGSRGGRSRTAGAPATARTTNCRTRLSSSATRRSSFSRRSSATRDYAPDIVVPAPAPAPAPADFLEPAAVIAIVAAARMITSGVQPSSVGGTAI